MPDNHALLDRPFRFYVRRHFVLVFFGTLWLFLTNLMDSLVPALTGMTIDKITANEPFENVLTMVGWIFAVTILMSAFRFLWRFFWATFHHSVANDLRDRLFAAMSELGPTFFKPRKIGQLISLISNDVNSFRMGIGPGMLVLLDGIFLTVLILPQMIHISPTWTWQTLALMPFVPFLVSAILSKLHVAFHQRQERFADFSGSAQEIISGVRVIKSFAQEHNQTVQFNAHSRSFQKACDQVSFWDGFFGPSLELPVALGSVILLVLGSGPVMRGEISVGQFIAFYQYIQRMLWPMSAIGIGLGHIQEGRASFARIREVLEFKPDVADEGEIEISEFVSLEAKNLSFTYPGAKMPALENVSFVLRRGERLGITGKTGAGKSTLIELLTRQYSVPSGTLLLNGISIEKIKASSLRRLMGVVPQDAFLFSRKVAENVAFGQDQWSLDVVREATRNVNLESEIDEWPGAFDALVGERGVNLSGGQKQRMTLARALIGSHGLVLLDDALSAVDAKTEAYILQQLKNDLEKTTSIVVSHRLASLKDSDQILVLSKGRIEARGRHDELLRDSPIYKTLSEMQS